MSQILTQNSKMKKSSQNGIDIYNFGISAFLSQDGTKTCPNAGVCATGCYARSGTYRFGNVVNAYESRLKLTQSESFQEVMLAEIRLKSIKSKAKGNECIIRIHDSGDFYSEKYQLDWLNIVYKCPEVRFYAYTKMIQDFEEWKRLNLVPPNLTIIYSMGGKQDSQIDIEKHRHSKVFQSETELLAQGYIDTSHDDLNAIGPCLKIGLVYHGQKSYSNTQWSKSK